MHGNISISKQDFSLVVLYAEMDGMDWCGNSIMIFNVAKHEGSTQHIILHDFFTEEELCAGPNRRVGSIEITDQGRPDCFMIRLYDVPTGQRVCLGLLGFIMDMPQGSAFVIKEQPAWLVREMFPHDKLYGHEQIESVEVRVVDSLEPENELRVVTLEERMRPLCYFFPGYSAWVCLETEL